MFTRRPMKLNQTRMGRVMPEMGKMWALIKAEFQQQLSYGNIYLFRQAFQFGFLRIVMIYFVGLTFGGTLGGWVGEYGGNYSMFILLGIILADMGNSVSSTTSGFLLSAQGSGVLEPLLMSPASIWTYIISYTLSSTFDVTIRSVVAFAAATVIWGGFAPLTLDAVLLSILFFLLFMTFTFSLGLMSAGFVVMSKQGMEPVSFVIDTLNSLLSGVYYPISILPLWIQSLAWILPQTHALNGMRLILLGGLTWQPVVMNSLAFLAVLNIPFLFFGIVILRLGFKFARQQGSLGYY